MQWQEMIIHLNHNTAWLRFFFVCLDRQCRSVAGLTSDAISTGCQADLALRFLLTLWLL